MAELGVGIAISSTMIVVTVGMSVVASGGSVSILPLSPTETLAHALVGIVQAAGVAIMLALLFDGFVLKNALEGLVVEANPERLQIITIVGIIAALYAIVPVSHGVQINTPDRFVYYWLFGVLTASTYVLTGRLSIPIGLHFGREFARTWLFDFDPSMASDLFVPVVRFSPVDHGIGSSPTGPVALSILLLGLIGTVLWLKRRDVNSSIAQRGIQ